MMNSMMGMSTQLRVRTMMLMIMAMQVDDNRGNGADDGHEYDDHGDDDGE